MGFRPSPYNTCRSFLWGEEIIWGNPKDTHLPFHYDSVKLNMPWSSLYRPDQPWLMKVWDDGKIASDVISHIDNLHTIGASEELCEEVTKRVALVVNYLGMQDAPRKRRPPSKTPGAWAGSLVLMDNSAVQYATFQEEKA